MRKIPALLLVPVICCAAAGAAQARPYRALVPVVEETRTYSSLPRDAAATPDVDVGEVLIGSEVPATVDVYALTEDEVADIPVASIDRRVSLRAVPLRPVAAAWRHRRAGLVVKG